MPIKGHIETTGPAGDARQFARRNLYLETNGGQTGGEPANVAVHNISETGMLVEAGLDLAVGSTLSVELPHHGLAIAQVVWASGRFFGCRFERKISHAALSAVQLKADAPRERGLDEALGKGSSNVTLGKVLEQTRKARGLTLAQVANQLGVSKPTVWAWEKGKARPVDERFPAIAQVLGLSARELVESDQRDDVSQILDANRERIADALGIDAARIKILIEI